MGVQQIAVIPRKAAGDAAHIAIATVYGCEYLLTWNCRHIANAELHRAIRRVVEQHGYEVPSLCTPEELMGENGKTKQWKRCVPPGRPTPRSSTMTLTACLRILRRKKSKIWRHERISSR